METTILILSLIALGLGAAAITILILKQRTESAIRAELDIARTKANAAAVLESQLDEVQSQRTALLSQLETKESQLQSKQDAIADLTGQVRDATARVEAEVRRCSDLIEREKLSQSELLKAKDEQITQLGEYIERADEALKSHFKALSAETLKDANEQLQLAAKQIFDHHSELNTQKARHNKQEIEQLMQPMGKTLERLDKQILETTEKRVQAETELMTVIRESASTNEKLANALSKPVIRGSWAEVKLSTLLEAAGLVRDQDFELQVQVRDGESTRIVDALVNMAQGKRLVIDSKNLMQVWVAYANAETEESQQIALTQFRTAFRTTVKALSLKDYSRHWEGIDAVLMFLPDEGMYSAAIEADRNLISMMYEHRVFVVSPITMLPILKSIGYIISLERLNRDTEQMAEAGRNLYESLGILAARVKTLGDRMESGVEAFNDMVGSLEANVLPKTRQLKQLGAGKGKEHVTVRELTVEPRELKPRIRHELTAATLPLDAASN